MHREIINAMTVDELRNYVVHQGELISSLHGVIYNQKEVINAQRQLISNLSFMYDAIISKESREHNFHQIEMAIVGNHEDLFQKQSGNVQIEDNNNGIL